MRTVSALIFTLSSAAALASPTPYSIELSNPTENAKGLGQRFYREISLHVEPPFTLDKNSIPLPKRTGLYLQQQAIELRWDWQAGWNAYTLRIPYQVIGQSDKRAFAIVPAFVVDLRDGDQNFPVVLEPFSVEIKPGPAMTDRATGTALPLAPPHPPPNLPLAAWLLAALSSAALLALLCCTWLWRRVLGPLWRRHQRPFAQAARALRRLPKTADESHYAALAHRAFNASAGSTVLSCDVPAFLASQPHVAPHADAISAFFQASDNRLFAQIDTADSKHQITELLQRCAHAEAAQ